jgi:hypothetical protein
MPEQLADGNDPDDRDQRGDDGWQDLAVANPTFLLERLGAECGDLQFLRELTVNSTRSPPSPIPSAVGSCGIWTGSAWRPPTAGCAS